MIALRDPAGFTDQVAVFPLPLLDLVSLFDGEHSVAEIQEIIRTRHGEEPTAEQIGNLVASLDAAGFLESEQFEARRHAIDEAFRQSVVRPAVHAGGAYEREPDALAAQVDAFFTHPDGPGALPHPRSSGSLRGLIAPHIDFHRGGPVYGWAYRALLEQSSADLYIVLGTCHAGMADPFALTLKPYDTPFRAVPVVRPFGDALGRRYGSVLLGCELAHRSEHSIEFQAVMLRHVLGDRPFSIVPVLASFLHEAIWSRSDPEADPRVPRFVDALL